MSNTPSSTSPSDEWLNIRDRKAFFFWSFLRLFKNWDFFPKLLEYFNFGIIFPNMGMQEQTLRAMNQALRKVLTPLVRVMIRFGFSYGTFSEIARSVFVE